MKIIIYLMLFTFVIAGATGCSPETTSTDQTEKILQDTHDETEYTEKNTISDLNNNETDYGHESGSQEVTDDLDETDIFDSSDLQGTVLEFTDSGCTISPQAYEGDNLAYEAAEGVEDDAEKVLVLYTDDVKFHLAVANAAQQAVESVESAKKSDLKKQSEVYLFGSYQEDNTFLATKVVVVKWNS
ncbi:MAG TPA: hypothetical protein IAC41_04380 [Candidatus Merdenecus merdavium]|nr:hypothetical protein [Candidatus Merdenecus merdavium]